MTEGFPATEMPLREATDRDIPALARHHRMMFEEVWQAMGKAVEGVSADAVEEAYARKLRAQINSGACKAWAIEDRGNIAASGAISIVSYVPTLLDPSSDVAYLHSMFTEKDYRGRRCASRIIHQALEYCRSRGIKRIMLFASDAGRPIYEHVGFSPVPNMMRLLLE